MDLRIDCLWVGVPRTHELQTWCRTGSRRPRRVCHGLGLWFWLLYLPQNDKCTNFIIISLKWKYPETRLLFYCRLDIRIKGTFPTLPPYITKGYERDPSLTRTTHLTRHLCREIKTCLTPLGVTVLVQRTPTTRQRTDHDVTPHNKPFYSGSCLLYRGVADPVTYLSRQGSKCIETWLKKKGHYFV